MEGAGNSLVKPLPLPHPPAPQSLYRECAVGHLMPEHEFAFPQGEIPEADHHRRQAHLVMLRQNLQGAERHRCVLRATFHINGRHQ